jgi:WD40 repeat protein
MSIELYDNCKFKRHQIIENHLDEFFPDVIAKLICTYDRYLDGTMTSFECYPERLSTIDGDLIYNMHCMCVLRDGRIVVGCDNIWKIFDPLTGRCDATRTTQRGSIIQILELQDGRIVICYWRINKTRMQIWNLQTKKCDVNLYQDHCTMQIVELSDGRIMGHGCRDDIRKKKKIIVTIWKLDTSSLFEKLVISFENYVSNSYTINKCLKMFPNGQIIVLTNHHTLAQWNPQTKDIHIISKNNHKDVDNILMLSNGQIITINVHEIKISTHSYHKKNHKKEDFKIIAHEVNCILDCIEIPDDQIAYLCGDGNLKIYDLKTNICAMMFPIDPAPDIIDMLPSGSIISAAKKGIVTVVS